MPLYLVDYIGSGTQVDPWRPRGSDQPGWSAIKLGPGGPAARCLLWLPLADPSLAVNRIGDDKLDTLGPAVRARIESILGIVTDGTAVTLRDLLRTLLLRPPGNRWKALQPARGRYEIWLGGERWLDQPIGQSSIPTLVGALAARRVRLTRRQVLLLAGLGLLTAWPRRAWAASYQTPFTTNENPLSEGGMWSTGEGDGSPHKKASGRCNGTTTGSRDTSRLTLSVSGDHFGHAEAYLVANVLVAVGIITRMVGGADESAYVSEAFINGSTPGSQIYEWAGAFGTTVLQSGGPGFSTGDVLWMEAIGSTLNLYQNGTLQLTATDTTLTGGSVGIYTFTGGADTGAEIDNFVGGDIGGYLLTEASDCLNAENNDRLIMEEAIAGVGPCGGGAVIVPTRTLLGVGL